MWQIIKEAWDRRQNYVFPSDRWNPVHGAIWGFPISLMYLLKERKR